MTNPELPPIPPPPPYPVPNPPIYIRAKYYLPQIGFVYCNFDGIIRSDQTKPTDGTINDNISDEEALYEVRMYRNSLLTQSDWTQLPDVPLTPNQVAAWRVYRQQLRDFLDSIDVPNWTAPNWPVPPS